MLKVGIIGIGNCGNQIASLAKKTKSLNVLAINSSEKDIDSIQNGLDCVIFGDHEGCGKDRSIALDFVRKNYKDLLENGMFQKFMNENQFIFIINSTGGGTGSGMGPVLTHILRDFYNQEIYDDNDPNKKFFINIGVLPSIGESIGSQRNTIQYLSEMTRLGTPFMLFDNNNSRAKSTDQMMETINKDVVEAISVIRGDRSVPSPYGMIDDKDMRKIVTYPGMIFMNILENVYVEKISNDGSVEDLIIDNINRNNHMVNVDRDKIVKCRGYIANISEDLRPFFDSNLPKINELYGEPQVQHFEHFAINESEDAELNSLVLIMSGLSMPDNRLKMIAAKIKESEEALKKKKESNLLDSLVSKVNEFGATPAKKETEGRSARGFNASDIFSNY